MLQTYIEMAKVYHHENFQAPPTFGLTARGLEILKFTVAWQSHLSSVYPHAANFS
jgi:hypothetical protein